MGTATAAKKEKDFQTRTNEYAAMCIESMKDDLDALHHAQECDGTDPETGKPCKVGSETRKFKGAKGKTYEQNIHKNPEVWHDEDRAREAIEQGHYGVQVRSDWHNPGENGETSEYCVSWRRRSCFADRRRVRRRRTIHGGIPVSGLVQAVDRRGDHPRARRDNA